MLEGGSVALLALLARPEKLVAADISPGPVPALEEFVQRRSLEDVVAVHFGVDQADREALARPELRGFGGYSVATLVVIAASGPVAALATARQWSTMGLLERLPIFGFVQWAAVTSVILARSQSVSPQPTTVASRRT